MSNEAIEELIVEHALASEANLDVACAVHAAFQSIAETIVRRFLKALEPTLLKTLGNGWDLRTDFLYINREYRVFTLGQAAWIEACPIQLRAGAGLKNVYIGIFKNQKPFTIFPEQAEERIRANLERTFRIEHNPDWVAYWSIQDKKYGVWNESQTLKKMYLRTDDFVSYYNDMVSAWAKAISSVFE